jgi:UDP-3-O-acyl-N-acetylglucosamine deacetylase
MALVCHPMIGHLVAHRGGHALHTAFAATVLEESDAWTLVDGRGDASHVVAAPLTTPDPIEAN